jgi:hypothetical protein
MGKGTNHLDRIRVNFDSNDNFTSVVDKTKQTMKPEDFPLWILSFQSGSKYYNVTIYYYKLKPLSVFTRKQWWFSSKSFVSLFFVGAMAPQRDRDLSHSIQLLEVLPY